MKTVKRISTYMMYVSVAIFVMDALIFLVVRNLSVPYKIALNLGLFGVAFYLLFNGYDLIRMLRKQTVRESVTVIIMVPIVFGVFCITYMIADGHKLRYDLTESQRFSLSSQTIQIIQSLDVSVSLLCFFKDGQPGKEMLKTGLEQYVYYSDKVTFEFIDPDRYPLRAKEFAVEQYGEIVVTSERGQERLLNSATEEALTNAILKATATDKKVLYFLVGHGERDLESGERDGYSLVGRHLGLENYEIKTISLMRSPSVPIDAAAVIIASPQTDFFEEELHILKKYIFENNGKVLILNESVIPETLREFCQDFGVTIGKDIVVDKMSQLFGANFDTAIITQYERHEITKSFTVASFFPTAPSLSFHEEAVPAGMKAQYLAYSGQGSWAETDLELLKQGKASFDDGDSMGPVPVGLVMSSDSADENADSAKIVIYNDSDFISNTYLKFSGNKDLFLNTIAWLAGDMSLIAIRPKQVDATPLFMHKSQSTMIFVLPVVVMPLIVIALGIFALIQRKK